MNTCRKCGAERPPEPADGWVRAFPVNPDGTPYLTPQGTTWYEDYCPTCKSKVRVWETA